MYHPSEIRGLYHFRPFLKGKPTGFLDFLSGGGCATGVWLIRHNCWGFARCFFFFFAGGDAKNRVNKTTFIAKCSLRYLSW